MNFSIILSGGEGRRLCSEVDISDNRSLPKQLIPICDKPIICHTLSAFEQCSDVDDVIVVSNVKFIDNVRDAINGFGYSKVCDVVPGGKSFWDSIKCGVDAVSKKFNVADNDIVTIHGACCPLVTASILSKNIMGAKEYGLAAASPPNTVSTWPIRESSIEDSKGKSKKIALCFKKRDSYAQIQLPYSFRMGVIKKVLDAMKEKTFPEGCNPVFHAGYNFLLTEGAYENIKITTKAELDFVKKLLP